MHHVVAQLAGEANGYHITEDKDSARFQNSRNFFQQLTLLVHVMKDFICRYHVDGGVFKWQILKLEVNIVVNKPFVFVTVSDVKAIRSLARNTQQSLILARRLPVSAADINIRVYFCFVFH